MRFSIVSFGRSVLNCSREVLGCAQQCVDILFTCRIMDQLPSGNLGKAANDYWNCMHEKCCSCPTNKNNVELSSNNNVPSSITMMTNVSANHNPNVNLMGSLPTNSEQTHSDDW